MTYTTTRNRPDGELVSPGSDAAATIEAARAAVSPTEITVLDDDSGDVELRLYGWHPDEGAVRIDTVDLEQRRDHPRAKTGAIRVATPEALVRYARRHAHDVCTTLWADIDAGKLTVVLNDHEDGHEDALAGWGDHRVEMALQRSPEWKAWQAINDRLMGQVELAEFLEEHYLEVLQPDGSTLIEVTQTFHATSGAQFKSAQRLDSGEQRLVYEENIEARAGRNQSTEIPTDLKIGLRPWVGVDPVAVDAKFRFRVRDGGLGLAVKLLRLDEVSRDAVTEACLAVEQELGLDAIEGTVPPARR